MGIYSGIETERTLSYLMSSGEIDDLQRANLPPHIFVNSYSDDFSSQDQSETDPADIYHTDDTDSEGCEARLNEKNEITHFRFI